MADADSSRPPPLPLRRHLNWIVLAGLLTTLTIPIGSTVAEYEGEVWPNVFTLGAALVAFVLLAVGLRLGPTKDARKVARDGVPARAVVERVTRVPLSKSGGEDGPPVAQVMRLDLRVEAEGEPATRVRLRRWVHVDKLDRLQPGTVLQAKVLPGRPQDPALGLRHPG